MKQEEIKRHKAKWESKGVTQKAYCESVGIGYKQFTKGLYRLRQAERKKSVQKVGFQQVELLNEHGTKDKRAYCEIRFNEEDSITISSKESLKTLKEVLVCLLN